MPHQESGVIKESQVNERKIGTTEGGISPYNIMSTGCFFNSRFYDLALIQSYFGIFEIERTFFHSIYRRIFKNATTLLILV